VQAKKAAEPALSEAEVWVKNKVQFDEAGIHFSPRVKQLIQTAANRQ
jgi:hypothetical protein